MTRSTMRIKHAHDVLDPDDRNAEPAADLFEHLGGAVHLGRVEPAEALVGEQQLRPGRERAGELELFERGGAEPVGRRPRLGRQPDQIERLDRAALGLAAGDMAALGEIGRQCRHCRAG